jgi:hypothetical protein
VLRRPSPLNIRADQICDRSVWVEPDGVHEALAWDAELVACALDRRPRRALKEAEDEVIRGEQQGAEVGDAVSTGRAVGSLAAGCDLFNFGLGDPGPVALGCEEARSGTSR